MFPQNTQGTDYGQIDCLIGFDYSAYHPVMVEANNHLLLQRNIFGMVIGGFHPELKEGTECLIQYALVNKVTACIDDFYSIKNLGVECNPKCGSCKCGKCQIRGNREPIRGKRNNAD